MKDFTVDGYAFFHFEVDTGALLFLGCVFNRSPKAELSVSWYLWYRVFWDQKCYCRVFFRFWENFEVWVRLRWLETGIFFHLCRDLTNFLRYTWLLLNFCLMALNFAKDFFGVLILDTETFKQFWFWKQNFHSEFQFPLLHTTFLYLWLISLWLQFAALG